MAGRKIAVVLFNLGGPDGPAAVRPFLRNLFSDPAIIGLPAPFRQMLAWLISTTRAKSARANYALMGGGSPLLPETEKQAMALETQLCGRYGDDEVRVFIAMRYWKPFTAQTARDVAAYGADEVVLLPLYPQFSTTTTGSSLGEWARAYKGAGKVRAVCCYPGQPDFIAAHAAKVAEALGRAEGPVRLLFSAHGLPKKVIDAGDPYEVQVQATAAAILAALGREVDHVVCYQSRVGPLEWIGPSTVEAIEAACAEGIGVVICPIAFVSEHIETLVELDEEYKILAESLACQTYIRVPALGCEAGFVTALADLTATALTQDQSAAPGAGWSCEACGPICPARAAA